MSTDEPPPSRRARPGLYLIVAGLAFAAVLIAGWRTHQHHLAATSASAAQVLKVGNQVGGTRALMEAAGVLGGVPYKIEWSLFPAASPLLEALGAGAIDTGGVGDAPFAFAYASGAKIRAVSAYQYSGAPKAAAILVPVNSPLKTVQDLKGRKIATVRGSAGQDLVLRVLERAGLQPSDVKFIYLSNGDAKAALATGAVDAWSTWASYVGIGLLHDHDRAIADATGLTSGNGFQVATDSAIANKRAILNDFLRRLALAYAWARQHPDAHAVALAKETGIPLDVARLTAQAVYQPIPIDAALSADERRLFDRYKRAGLIDHIPDVSGAYDPSFNGAIPPPH
jgi:sulfonate transport system substrate-binding protein